jgi:hypothetical protein
VPGAHVRVLEKSLALGILQYLDRGASDTGANGEFTVTKLRPGRYVVLAEPEDDSAAAKESGQLVMTFFPRSLSVEGADDLDIAPGYSPTGLTLYLQRAAAHHVRGRLSPSLRTLHPSELSISPQSPAATVAVKREISINKNGSFDIGLTPPGLYLLRASGERNKVLARLIVEVGNADLNDVDLNPLPRISITGSVTVDGSDSSRAQQPAVIVAIPVTEGSSRPRAVARTGPDGIFQFDDLDPEEWQFEVSGGMGTFVESMLFNGQDVLNRSVDLSEAPSGKLEIVLKHGAASIGGTVTVGSDESPARNFVILVPSIVDPTASNLLFTSTNTSGEFMFPELRPDEYTVFAVRQPDQDLWRNASFLQQMRNSGTRITVKESEREQVQLSRTPDAEIAAAALQAGVPEP